MTNLISLLLLLGSGLLVVSAIDSIGSVTSRKWKYNYACLSPLSFLAYGAMGYLGQRLGLGLTGSLTTAVAVGIYDASVGWRISVVLKANWGRFRRDTEAMTPLGRIRGVIVVALAFGFLGFQAAQWLV